VLNFMLTLASRFMEVRLYRFGNRYFENRNPEEEVPGGYSFQIMLC